jgi:hypothetical protein
MRELSNVVLASDDAALNFPDMADTPAERAIAAVLNFVVRLWCLPFLVLAWMLTWTAIAVIRSLSFLSGATEQPGKWHGRPMALGTGRH